MLINGEVKSGDTLKIGSQHGNLKFEVVAPKKEVEKVKQLKYLILTKIKKYYTIFADLKRLRFRILLIYCPAK